jgi:uncharacterized protein
VLFPWIAMSGPIGLSHNAGYRKKEKAFCMSVILIPGIGDSGPAHWQSLWQADDPAMVRIAPQSWDAPDLADWIKALQSAVDAAATTPVLIAHSLGCLLVAHWSQHSQSPVRAALLVAVPDPDGPAFPPQAAGFGHLPMTLLRFPSLMVASTNDPYARLTHAEACAKAWGSQLHVAGALGHINGQSGIGDWPQGKALWQRFLSQPV